MNIASTDYVDSKASGEFKSDRWLLILSGLPTSDFEGLVNNLDGTKVLSVHKIEGCYKIVAVFDEAMSYAEVKTYINVECPRFGYSENNTWLEINLDNSLAGNPEWVEVFAWPKDKPLPN